MVTWLILSFFFFFKQKTAYEMRISDWSSDVCSSDLLAPRSDSHPPSQCFTPVIGLIRRWPDKCRVACLPCAYYGALTGPQGSRYRYSRLDFHVAARISGSGNTDGTQCVASRPVIAAVSHGGKFFIRRNQIGRAHV